MRTMDLADAHTGRRARGDDLLAQRVEAILDGVGLSEARCVELSNADRVGPTARKRLSGLMKHYGKMAHPFTACVRDNTKRFGRDRAERVCAVLKDLIRGTTKWREGGKRSSTSLSMSESMFCSEVDDEIATLLSLVDLDKLKLILAEEPQA